MKIHALPQVVGDVMGAILVEYVKELMLDLDNEEKMYNFDVELNDRDFTPQALRRAGKR